MPLKVGDKAPAFQLYSDSRKPLRLEDFSGQPLVLLFFPLAFSSVCTKELCTMRDSLGEYDRLDAAVVAVSVDSVYTLAHFKASERLNFPLLSDFNKEVSRQYGCLYDTFTMDMHGVSKRAAFVIDGEGVIRYAEVLESAGNQPDYSAVRATLAAL
ncbi:redoxin domain-containing protein [Neolewinella litorea]|uniref:Redoxin domain-containing protein n=1 Tax=Neolewinella litorea TaxID=2562452 RepID=A0A4S4NPP5_9BACT|nr:redoxin domain-containing protein [Neolewinella litorea]THH40381.1 redoxin domain-containing protein [Neolewinella litorea]